MTPPPEEQANLNALSNLLEMKGLNASDFIDVINALSNIKQRDAAKEEKEEEKASKIKNKIFVDKEFVFEGREDAFIYKDGRTKRADISSAFMMQIRKNFVKSKNHNRIEALSKAQELRRKQAQDEERCGFTQSIRNSWSTLPKRMIQREITFPTRESP